MTKEECVLILKYLNGLFPGNSALRTDASFNVQVGIYYKKFKKTDFKLVQDAVDSYSDSGTAFFPKVGQIVAEVNKLKTRGKYCRDSYTKRNYELFGYDPPKPEDLPRFKPDDERYKDFYLYKGSPIELIDLRDNEPDEIEEKNNPVEL